VIGTEYKSQSTFGGTQLVCIGIPHNVGKAFNYCLTVCNDISNCPTSLIAIFVMFFGTERFLYSLQLRRGSHGCDRMVVGFTTTYAISAYILFLLVKKSSKSNKSRLWNNVFKKCGFT
jgi:hypothetical protein